MVLHTPVHHGVNMLLAVCVYDSVYVGQSLISGAGEGLFAKMDADADTVMAFYNGVRVTHSEVCL